MIIESAFLKLPEVLLSYDDQNGLYEAHIVGLLTNAIILEFNARNIDNPLRKIQLEKRYDNQQNARCDLFADFDFYSDDKICEYGYYKENWIEVKYFGGLARNKGLETTSENAGAIAADLYRLANSAAGGKCRGLYSLVIFNQNPERYLAFKRKDQTEREWLRRILKPGGANVSMFSSREEPSSVMNPFKGTHDIALSMVTRTLSFAPYTVNNGFWGYLIQLMDFSITDDKRYNWGFRC